MRRRKKEDGQLHGGLMVPRSILIKIQNCCLPNPSTKALSLSPSHKSLALASKP